MAASGRSSPVSRPVSGVYSHTPLGSHSHVHYGSIEAMSTTAATSFEGPRIAVQGAGSDQLPRCSVLSNGCTQEVELTSSSNSKLFRPKSMQYCRLASRGRRSIPVGEGALAAEWVTVQELADQGSRRRQLIGALVFFGCLVFCILFFACTSRYNLIDATYFVVVTIFTVGYGDLHPTTGLEKLCVVFMTFMSMGFVAAAVGTVLDDFAWSAGDPTAKHKRPAVVILELVLTLCAVLAVGAIPYSYLEGHSLLNSIYWAGITVATVGYGDQAPTTLLGRAFAVVYIAIGSIVTAQSLATLARVPIRLRQQQYEEHVETQFGDKLSKSTYEVIIQKVEHLKLTRSSGPATVSQAEFALAMLLSLGRISEEDVAECVTTFDHLDGDHDGLLTPTDVTVTSRFSFSSESLLVPKCDEL